MDATRCIVCLGVLGRVLRRSTRGIVAFLELYFTMLIMFLFGLGVCWNEYGEVHAGYASEDRYFV